MKVLLVNNLSDTWDELQVVVRKVGHEVFPVRYDALGTITPQDYDFVVLSGGWWYDDEIQMLDEYGEELEFIRICPIPLLGICIGMQLMHVSLDKAVPLLDAAQSGSKAIFTTDIGRNRYALPEAMSVHKNHTRGVIEADPVFDILATSPGHIEIIRHRERPMLGVQFHPEVGELRECVSLMRRLISMTLY